MLTNWGGFVRGVQNTPGIANGGRKEMGKVWMRTGLSPGGISTGTKRCMFENNLCNEFSIEKTT